MRTVIQDFRKTARSNWYLAAWLPRTRPGTA
jgi:hypothetical protein